MSTTARETPSPLSLYEQLGGEAGIHELIDTIVDAHMANPVIRARFIPYRDDPERLVEIKRQLCAFFAAGTGGPDDYQGRSMPEAHRGMNIDEAEYVAATDDILDALAQHGIDADTRTQVLSIVYGLKGEITHV